MSNIRSASALVVALIVIGCGGGGGGGEDAPTPARAIGGVFHGTVQGDDVVGLISDDGARAIVASATSGTVYAAFGLNGEGSGLQGPTSMFVAEAGNPYQLATANRCLFSRSSLFAEAARVTANGTVVSRQSIVGNVSGTDRGGNPVARSLMLTHDAAPINGPTAIIETSISGSHIRMPVRPVSRMR